MRRTLALTCTILLAACNGWTPVSDPALAPSPPASAASPFGHGYKTTEALTGPGLLLSSWAGNAAAAMTDGDIAANRRAERSAFNAPLDQPVAWHAETGGDAGQVTATRDYYDDSGAYCRQFQQSLTVGGASATGEPRACQQPDGSWKIAG